MNVLMTADAVGGVWTYVLELARALQPQGIRLTIAVMGPRPTGMQLCDAESCQNVHVIHGDYRLEWMEDPWPDVERSGEWLLALTRETKADIVHINGYSHAVLPFGVPVVVVAHSCVLSWWRGVHGSDAPPAFHTYKTNVQRGLHAADVVVAPTRAILTAIEAHYGQVDRSAVIPNGRALSFGQQVGKEPVIFAAGRAWDPMKNIAALAAAAPRVSWPIFLAGEEISPNGRRVSLGAISPLGFLDVEQMTAWYARASIFVHPARYEPFGLAPLEAALGGCALVLSDIATLREVWEDDALYVPPNDHDALADALSRLVGDRGLRKKLAGRARARAQRFTPQRMGAAYLEVYRSCVS